MPPSKAPLTDPSQLALIWQRLLARLAQWEPQWRANVGLDAPRPVSRDCGSGPAISDNEAFEAFAVAMLSGNTRWDRIERVRESLGEPFDGFRPELFATRSDRFIEATVLPWFRRHRAGTAGLRAGLLRLRQTAHVLAGGGRYASADAFVRAACAEAEGSPEGVAMLFGASKDWKLPGFGIALAAEALRILGFDLCKPDRHICRATGSWGLVRFTRWEHKGPFTPPQARPPELLATMLAVRALAEANGVGVSHANSVIWTAGAVSGARLTNAEFAELAAR